MTTHLDGAPAPLPAKAGASLGPVLGNLVLPDGRPLRDVGLADLKRALRAAGVVYPLDGGQGAIARAYSDFIDDLRRDAADRAERAWKERARGFSDGYGRGSERDA